jgi:nucleoside-triphosphatase
VGKYRVDLEDLENIGVQAINYAMENCDIIAIDEVGPMELFSEKFKNATRKAMESIKPVIAVVHWKAQDKLINEARNMKNSETYTVTTENRNELSKIIADKATILLKKTDNQ